MKSASKVAVFLSAALLLGAPAYAQQKIGYVDMQRVAAEIDQVKVAKAKLKATFDKKQKELDQKQEALAKDMAALESAAKDGVMSEEKLREKRDALQKKYKEATEYLQAAQKSLTEDQQKAFQEIMSKVNTVVRGIAKESGFSLVVNGDPAFLLYGDDGLDLTSEVIRKYNAQYPTKK